MTLRHKLADWISGGELTRLRREAKWQAERADSAFGIQQAQFRRHLRLDTALRSIASSTCCEGCQEAARVAKAALYPQDMSRTTIGQAAIAREALE